VHIDYAIRRGMTNCLDFRRINKTCKVSELLPFSKLQELYLEISEQLNQLYPQALKRTKAEIRADLAIRSSTKLQIFRNFWVGNCNIDFFIPALSGEFVDGKKGYSGLAIEVDGEVHDREFKIRKDHHKIDILKDFGVLVYSLMNEDIKSPQFIALLKVINKLKTIDARRKKRLLRNIYTYTLYLHRIHLEDRIKEVLGNKNYEFFTQLERYYDR
jgi:very-short-patch-repair endonuclease